MEAASGIWGADRLFKGYTGSKISKKSVKIFKFSKKKTVKFARGTSAARVTSVHP